MGLTFIGSNDRETLLGVIEEIDRELRSESIKARTAKLQRDKYAAVYAVAKLSFLRGTFEDASKNGPTPDLSKISEMKFTLTPESRERLAAAVIDAESDMVGMNVVDPAISCAFCGADLLPSGACSQGISDDCTVSPRVFPDLEARVFELANKAGIVVSVIPSNDDSWFILFDGSQIGSRRTRTQAFTSALERLSVRLQGKLHGSPDTTFGACIPHCSQRGDMEPKIVYFRDTYWKCDEQLAEEATGK